MDLAMNPRYQSGSRIQKRIQDPKADSGSKTGSGICLWDTDLGSRILIKDQDADLGSVCGTRI